MEGASDEETFVKIAVGVLVGAGAFMLARGRRAIRATVAPSGARTVASRGASVTPSTSAPRVLPGLAGGILLRNVKAGSFERPSWVDVRLGDVTVTVAADNLRSSPDGSSPPVRLPVTWPETVGISQALSSVLAEDVIAPSQKVVDAIHAAAKIRTAFHGQGTDAMLALSTVDSFNRDVDRQIASSIASGSGVPGGLVSGHEKYWILHPRLDQATNDAALREFGLPPTGPDPAVNYGAWDDSGKLIQTVGGRHNGGHYDQSQLYRPVKRWARGAGGARVDMLSWIESNDGVPARFTDLFRHTDVA